MKQLTLFVVLLLVLGVAGFLYRNTLERPGQDGAGSACTQEAKICPDGASVGRTGPDCAFATCPLPNKEIPALGIAFVIPTGYGENSEAPEPGDNLLIALEKPSLTPQVPHALVIRRYPIPDGGTANLVMLAETSYDTSGEPVKSLQEFTQVIINGHTYQSLTVDRFEAQVHTVYYLPRENDVLRFEVLERDVTSWMDPNLKVTNLPEHQTLLRLLGTLQN